MITIKRLGAFSLALAVALSAMTLQAAVVLVDDSFADGDFAKTGPLDTNWWTSSSSSGKEISVGSLGLVTGTSGRGIHTIFPATTLAVGDSLKASYTFTTPTTIQSSNSSQSAAFRVGLFDSLGQAGLDADVSASSGSPNDLYGWGLATGGPGTLALPGYMLDMDVYPDTMPNPESDLNFREHVSNTITGTGRLMATTSNFSNISPSGPDAGYSWAPNTEYTGSFQLTRINATEMELTATLGGDSYTNVDAFDSVDVDMLAFHVNSRTFGDSNSAGDPDNGIDFSNIKIEYFPVPEPSSLMLLLGSLLALAAGRVRK
ncbi:MAG: PEP-CTERM sorting domain-containing protein [Planctomycetota bacterium]